MNKSTYNGILFKYMIQNTSRSKGTLVLLDGLPSKPENKEDLINNLFNLGYDVFFPIYKGTFESKGEFLKQNPKEEILEFVSKLKRGLGLNCNYKATTVFLLGASFGGGIVLSLANNQNINKICAISLVLSFKKVKNIESLEQYLKEKFPNDYHFSTARWQVLINDEFYCPLKEDITHPEKVLGIAGSQDDQIPIDSVKDYCLRTKIGLIVKPTRHITLSKLDAEMLVMIDSFFTATAFL